MDMQQYFDAQMRLLTQAGKEFAQQYPEHAGQLNIDALKDRDPHVERLLEGVAYMTAYTQKRLDESLPEVSEQVLRQVCPLMLSNYPSTTIMQFTPKMTMQGATTVESGTQISSHGDKTTPVVCHFTTSTDTPIAPFEVYAVDYQEFHSGAKLSLKLKRLGQGVVSDYELKSLRFYLCGDTPLCASLYHLMTNASEHIEVSYGSHFDKLTQLLPKSSVSSAFGHGEFGILPNSDQCHPGYALLLDYFNSRERFYFVELNNFHLLKFDANLNTLDIEITSQVKLPPGHKVSHENIMLNCVPAVNLFACDAEPMRCLDNQTEYPITPIQEKSAEAFCFEVTELKGKNRSSGESVDFQSRYTSVFEDEKHLYSLVSKDTGGAAPKVYVQISMDDIDAVQTLSASTLAHNAVWPRQLLKEGDIHVPKANAPFALTMKNVIRPSKMLHCPKQQKHWLLIGLLNMRFSQLADPIQLKKLLALFDWSGRSENQSRITSIVDAHSKPISMLQKGVFVKGLEIHLTINEKQFVCLSDAYHFCDVLHQFFKLYAPINECLQTKVTCVPSYHTWCWQISSGESYQI
ncbi:type VI secretion system baseplate subunit TssF [Pseudoalteromonas luteoviolacea]|uniref:Type VI secretion protein n=1 Tax=Pseudoalteromonas luteoviolacea S4054 TaxID=1129367 RepID=A0A0F6A6S8_9GAMM|nr:type VI secretion system baseplate subunit TssF [Pseudoalteromonas luteoviolacea]AOT10932.1 type VI secretion protein [Pseudoalteromonas luteoviolacea]AOT15904.1 type VI secretion protein [Pseudoalteromonas luteoviolacea]AOT20753.1 type VI secretion protein [Pseudoalteromonas luteoviolacea]KKE81860.1 hypothetical protein N479_02550 [Pseudoalteromonas luteoviolacea S4054]KZN66182.1 hypothetical protein N481_24530 [Pseudoalteromonas luteoviolacea S4047-1]